MKNKEEIKKLLDEGNKYREILLEELMWLVNNVTGYELAKRTGKNESLFCYYKSGSRKPRFETIEEILRAYYEI